VGGAVRELRAQADGLGDFIEKIAKVKSFKQLLLLVEP